MPVYAYITVSADGSTAQGTLVADTPRAARDTLRSQGHSVRHLAEAGAAASSGAFHLPVRFRQRHAAKVLDFIRELSTLLGVGIPLLEAIDTIALQHKGVFHTILLRLRDRIAAGASLAEAMREQADVFDEFCIAITEVGENAGTLEQVLEKLADFKERSQLLKDRVGTALLYPCIVMVMAVAVSIFLMTFVVPKLLIGLVDAGKEIPLVTRIVKAASDLLVQDWWLLLLVGGAAALAGWLFLHSDSGRQRWHQFQLKVPILGEMVRKQAILRISVVISTLMRTGIVFVRALEISQRSVANVVIRGALDTCQQAVSSGQDISAALADTGAFPPVVVQIFAVGQQSGKLEEMLERLALDYDRQLTTAAQRLTAVLEPLLILFLVILVGFIAFATILPMLEAANVF